MAIFSTDGKTITHSAFANTCLGKLSGIFNIFCITTPQFSNRLRSFVCSFVAAPDSPVASSTQSDAHFAILKHCFIGSLVVSWAYALIIGKPAMSNWIEGGLHVPA